MIFFRTHFHNYWSTGSQCLLRPLQARGELCHDYVRLFVCLCVLSVREYNLRNNAFNLHDFYPRESFREDYGITGVRLSVCLFVCYYDN